MGKEYFVYILGSSSGTLYTGMTNDLQRRVYQHKRKLIPGFSREYTTDRLLYFEKVSEVRTALEREKQIKSLRREKKIALIESKNPKWEDLCEGWYEESGLELDKE